MRVALLTRKYKGISLHLYEDSVVEELLKLGVSFVRFSKDDPIPADCDLIWEPGIAGNRIPLAALREATLPIVATVHGAAPISMANEEYFALDRLQKPKRKSEEAVRSWEWFSSKVSVVIAVSKFTSSEVSRLFKVDPDKIDVIHHGVDRSIFNAEGKISPSGRPYILIVSQYQPRKNVDRVFCAYSGLSKKDRPRLVAVLPDYESPKPYEDDILIYDQKIPIDDLIKLYREALLFVFPSLYEGFGLPIIEAMACGCPVVTSSTTACPEVAADSAVLVDPRSTQEITKAMRSLIDDRTLRSSYVQKGLARAKEFTWQKSAKLHKESFDKAILLSQQN
jgi:glycosyltransferase involved in cell wall biosynthesis